MALLVLLKGRLCVSGQNQMCHLRAGVKLLACLNCFLAVLVNRFAYLFLKNAGGKKIKNIGSAMSIGLLVVRLLYCFYVCVYLSKWFTFLSFLVVCSLLSGRPLHLLPTVWRLAQWRNSELKTVNTTQKLIRGRMFN